MQLLRKAFLYHNSIRFNSAKNISMALHSWPWTVRLSKQLFFYLLFSLCILQLYYYFYCAVELWHSQGQLDAVTNVFCSDRKNVQSFFKTRMGQTVQKTCPIRSISTIQQSGLSILAQEHFKFRSVQHYDKEEREIYLKRNNATYLKNIRICLFFAIWTHFPRLN